MARNCSAKRVEIGNGAVKNNGAGSDDEDRSFLVKGKAF